jgi:hypothetical protein
MDVIVISYKLPSWLCKLFFLDITAMSTNKFFSNPVKDQNIQKKKCDVVLHS